MLRRFILALIGLLAVVNGSKWLFDGKRLPTLGIDNACTTGHILIGFRIFFKVRSVCLWSGRVLGKEAERTSSIFTGHMRGEVENVHCTRVQRGSRKNNTCSSLLKCDFRKMK